jgi:hypothetical protein
MCPCQKGDGTGMKRFALVVLGLFLAVFCGYSGLKASGEGGERAVNIPRIDMVEYENLETATFAMG